MLTADSLQHLSCTSSSICHLNAGFKGDLGDFKFLLRMNEFQKYSVLFPPFISLILSCVVLSTVLSNHFMS